MAKHDPYSFDFGFNVKPKKRRKRAAVKKGGSKRSGGGKGNAWVKYIGSSAPIPD